MHSDTVQTPQAKSHPPTHPLLLLQNDRGFRCSRIQGFQRIVNSGTLYITRDISQVNKSFTRRQKFDACILPPYLEYTKVPPISLQKRSKHLLLFLSTSLGRKKFYLLHQDSLPFHITDRQIEITQRRETGSDQLPRNTEKVTDHSFHKHKRQNKINIAHIFLFSTTRKVCG